jgi:DNA-binding transcriptional regulator YhcF (GntR family)
VDLSPTALLDRQDGPVLPIAADHFSGDTNPMSTTSQDWADLYAWQLDRASQTPLSRQIYMQVRRAVLSGALRAGTRVPSSRAMASQLGVARASVVSAYEQLLAEGYVESRHGSGTFISDEVAGLATRRRAPRAIKRAALPTSARAFPDFERSMVQGEARPFNTGRTLVDARTAETWRSLTHRAVRRLGPDDLGYADPAGLAELRANICDYLRVARAVRCEPDQSVVTAGTQQAIDIAIRVLLAPEGAAARYTGRRPRSDGRRRPARGAAGARGLRHALAPVSDWSSDVDGAPPGAAGVGEAERCLHHRG